MIECPEDSEFFGVRTHAERGSTMPVDGGAPRRGPVQAGAGDGRAVEELGARGERPVKSIEEPPLAAHGDAEGDGGGGREDPTAMNCVEPGGDQSPHPAAERIGPRDEPDLPVDEPAGKRAEAGLSLDPEHAKQASRLGGPERAGGEAVTQPDAGGGMASETAAGGEQALEDQGGRDAGGSVEGDGRRAESEVGDVEGGHGASSRQVGQLRTTIRRTRNCPEHEQVPRITPQEQTLRKCGQRGTTGPPPRPPS